jgi:hypothetical protein
MEVNTELRVPTVKKLTIYLPKIPTDFRYRNDYHVSKV